ncbi:carboxypeptidase regulatory-like domain-containing protein [Longimicrobium sp.]|uniref:carboxypeptidase regulatory-like domain-containing protein n=1 Tax=Longimicrobium sp. TaxID=2029185 RepID=UPI002CAE3388|nr:carboxypeptidase regulatory-like domain-containing protein [Longimicrobium sp.]HSU14421.1 carboxypeptidase regulatory-like domain-containing protein [Longimicrobium sp.]
MTAALPIVTAFSRRLPRARLAAACAVLACACAPAAAAAQGGSRVAGRVLDDRSGTPIPQALVRISGEGASVADTTDANGRYSLPLPAGGGPFTLRAERIGYRPLTVSVPGATPITWRDLRLATEAVALAPVVARPFRPDRQAAPPAYPGSTAASTLSWSAGTVPVQPGDLAGLAALEPGVQGREGGISFFGQPPSQTRVTLDGATFGATSLPQEAVASVSVEGSGYVVSRGQFSGGTVAATTLGGTNDFGAAVRSSFSPPALQWPAASLAGSRNEATFVHAEAGMGGPVVWNRLFWYAAASASRRTAPLLSLESAPPATLGAAGVQPDSAAALLATLGGLGLAGAGGGDARSDAGSFLVRMDWDVSERHSLMLRLDGRGTEMDGLGATPLATAASAASLRDRAGGVLARLSSYGSRFGNELSAYRSERSQRTAAGAAVPGGLVGTGGDSAFAWLRFGGGGGATRSAGSLLELSDALRVTGGGGHEWLAGGGVSLESASTGGSGNPLGTFTFATLADLRAGRPDAFTRTLGGRAGRARAGFGVLYLGDIWTRPRFAVTYGLRLERRWYPGSGDDVPPAGPFASAARRIPSGWGVSPRAGFAWTVGGWNLHGGAGEFRGELPLDAVASLLADGTDGEGELLCLGAAVPSPVWDAGGEPSACAGGAPAFSAFAPALTVVNPGFAAPLTRRASFGASTAVLGLAFASFEGSLTRGLHASAARDLNLRGTPAFTLAGEGGRPVYAPAARIDPATGMAAPGASRADAAWGIVREIGSGAGSTVVQATVRVSLPYNPHRMISARIPRLDLAYTWTRARDEVGALGALEGSRPFAAADPRATVRGPADFEQAHVLQARVGWTAIRGVRVGVVGRLGSGLPFTPRVDGDVNADGAANDPAFVFAPGDAAGTSLGRGMAALLAGAPGRIRACLERQAGRVAGRNGCRTGWTAGMDLRVDYQPLHPPRQRGLQLSLVTENALGLLDRLAHGAADAHGWGELPLPDATLLRVTGFDPAAGAYRYAVNPRFGRPDAAFSARPFRVTLEARVAVGKDPAYQPLQRLIRGTAASGRSPQQLRALLAGRIPNLPAQVLSVDSSARLALTADQRARLIDRGEALGAVLAPLADSLAQVVSDGETGRRRFTRATARQLDGLTRGVQAALEAELATIREILTPAQWSRLPEAIRLPPHDYVPARCIPLGSAASRGSAGCDQQ